MLCKDAAAVYVNYASLQGCFSAGIDWSKPSTWCAGTELLIGDFNGDAHRDLMCRQRQRLEIDYASVAPRSNGPEGGRFER